MVEPVQDRAGRGVLEPRAHGRCLCDSASALPTTHVSGVRFETGGDIIEGKALVSGTSFSAPKVAAYIAERMSTTGTTARVARDYLINHGVAPLPQCGTQTAVTGKAIVLASLTASINDPATAAPASC